MRKSEMLRLINKKHKIITATFSGHRVVGLTLW